MSLLFSVSHSFGERKGEEGSGDANGKENRIIHDIQVLWPGPRKNWIGKKIQNIKEAYWINISNCAIWLNEWWNVRAGEACDLWPINLSTKYFKSIYFSLSPLPSLGSSLCHLSHGLFRAWSPCSHTCLSLLSSIPIAWFPNSQLLHKFLLSEQYNPQHFRWPGRACKPGFCLPLHVAPYHWTLWVHAKITISYMLLSSVMNTEVTSGWKPYSKWLKTNSNNGNDDKKECIFLAWEKSTHTV